MSKRIVSLLLVFVMFISLFAACKKEEEERNFYVDEEGNTQYVEVDEEGKYYTVDKDGNVSYIDDDSIVEQIESNSQAAELDKIAEEVGTDPDKIFDDAENNKLEMSDELVEEDIVTVPGDSGESQAKERMNSYRKVLDSNKFTISATVKEVGTETTEYPFIYIRSGNGAYIETAVPFDEEGKVIKANMVFKDGVTYCVIPSIKSYMIVDDMGIEDLADGTFDGNEMKQYVFVESGTVTVNGKKYICDVYTVDGDTVKYYYDANENLTRIERIGKRDSVITEIKSVTNTADDSKIKKPSGFNITSLVN